MERTHSSIGEQLEKAFVEAMTAVNTHLTEKQKEWLHKKIPYLGGALAPASLFLLAGHALSPELISPALLVGVIGGDLAAILLYKIASMDNEKADGEDSV